MKAVRVHRFGPPEVIALEDVPKPEPNNGEVVVEVKAAGIGPWDALIRSGKSALPQPLPLVLGSDLSGVFDFARLSSGQSVLIQGGAGNVGGYAVQFAKLAGALVIATASAKDVSYVRSLGGVGVIDYRATRFEERVKETDAVIDTVGGDTLDRSY